MRNYHFVSVDENEVGHSVTIQAINHGDAVQRFRERFPRHRILAIDSGCFDLTVDEELPNGSRLQVAEWHGGVAEGYCEVRMNGRMVSETWDRDRAHAVAAWWRNGCQS